MLEIDRLGYQSRWLSLNPLAKFVLYLLLLGIALCSTPLVQAVMLLVLMPVTCYVVRISWQRYLKWLAIPFSFLLVSVIGIAVSFGRTDAGMLVSVQCGGFVVGIGQLSLSMANAAFFRSLSALAATYLFVLTTPFNQLVIILKSCRLPRLLIEQALLTYRFIFIFLEEAAAIHRAQSLRFGYNNARNSLRSLSMLAGMLLERVLIRHRQMVIALDVKLFNGDFHY